MNCEKIKEKLSLYIDNLLDSDEATQIKEHLESCDSCRAYYNKLLKLGRMVDDFILTDNEEHWESQKNKVIEQIEKAESEKIIKVQPVHKPNKIYKYLAVAASLALVAFVSIYESQDFRRTTGLFVDDKDVSSEQLIESDSTEDISIRGGRADEDSFEVTDLSGDAEKIISTDKLSQQEVAESVLPPKKRIEKAHAVDEDKEDVIESDRTESVPSVGLPEPEPSLQLGEPARFSDYSDDLESVHTNLRPAGLPSQEEEVAPLTIKIDTKKEKTDLSQNEKELEKSHDLIRDNNSDVKATTTFSSKDEREYIPGPPKQDADSTSASTEFNIYEIRLDSLEAEYPGIYSPHYLESSAKGRSGIAPDSLDKVVLELAETCFQVGILTLDDKIREEMIKKLQQLSIHGSPESIEKIQHYIVMLLAAD